MEVEPFGFEAEDVPVTRYRVEVEPLDAFIELHKFWKASPFSPKPPLQDEYTRYDKLGLQRLIHYNNGKWSSTSTFRDTLREALDDANRTAELRGGWAE